MCTLVAPVGAIGAAPGSILGIAISCVPNKVEIWDGAAAAMFDNGQDVRLVNRWAMQCCTIPKARQPPP